MRMSDWSSDVCSSDLEDRPQGGKAQRRAMARTAEGGEERRQQGGKGNGRAGRRTQPHRPGAVRPQKRRSEEHTSELQSLMRSSYAVCCLKKTKQQPLQSDYTPPLTHKLDKYTDK